MKIEKLKDDLVKTQSEYIQELKNMIELKDKYIEVLERSLDIQDNHIAKQNELMDEMKQSIETLVRDYNRLQSYHILNKTK